MINYLVPGEQITPQSVLKRLEEDGSCLLTKATENLGYMPVNADTQNILPSNMVCISNELAMTADTFYSYEFEVGLWQITFDTPSYFEKYNKEVLQSLLPYETEMYFNSYEPSEIPKIFEFLTGKHVKGISLIKNSMGYSMSDIQFQSNILRALARAEVEKKNSKSKIEIIK